MKIARSSKEEQALKNISIQASKWKDRNVTEYLDVLQKAIDNVKKIKKAPAKENPHEGTKANALFIKYLLEHFYLNCALDLEIEYCNINEGEVVEDGVNNILKRGGLKTRVVRKKEMYIKLVIQFDEKDVAGPEAVKSILEHMERFGMNDPDVTTVMYINDIAKRAGSDLRIVIYTGELPLPSYASYESYQLVRVSNFW